MSDSRRRVVGDGPVRLDREFVLYVMVAARRWRYNVALQRAVEQARELGLPLLVAEVLYVDDPHASVRHHTFVIQGMVDNARAFSRLAAAYYPFVETSTGEALALLRGLARRAAMVVSDDVPTPEGLARQAALAEVVDARLEVVDGNGLYPMRATTRRFTTAASFRRHLQRELPRHGFAAAAAHPLRGSGLPRTELPPELIARWPPLGRPRMRHLSWVAELPIDQRVGPVATRGGPRAAEATLESFIRERLPRYATQRNAPVAAASSNLSAYLRHGHLSSHEAFRRVMDTVGWSPARVAPRPTGARQGWWGADPSAEAFVDQLVTWRELGFNAAATGDDFAAYESLPGWARETLASHARDPRPVRYELEVLESARTGDAVWNAAQRQLVREGRMHNYLRMVWGKRILEWSAHPRAALATMLHLNDRYALDGGDPNSVSGVFWVLGRYDRPWGPERPIFGKVRFMSSERARRKLKLDPYLARYGPSTG